MANIAYRLRAVKLLILLRSEKSTRTLNFFDKILRFNTLKRFAESDKMRLRILALRALLVAFIPAQALSASATPLSTGGYASSASAALSTSSTDAGRASSTSSNPVSSTGTDFGRHSGTSSPLSSVALASETAGNGHASGSATPTGSNNGNKLVGVESMGMVGAAVAFVMALM
jgi:hypothetical protein